MENEQTDCISVQDVDKDRAIPESRGSLPAVEDSVASTSTGLSPRIFPSSGSANVANAGENYISIFFSISIHSVFNFSTCDVTLNEAKKHTLGDFSSAKNTKNRKQ